MINAGIKSIFLELLVINEKMPYKNILNNIYKGRFKSKQVKRNYLQTLKVFWEKNKDSLTVEILQLEKKSGDLASLNKDLSKEDIDSNNVFSLSENKCDSEIEIMCDCETDSNNSDNVFDLSEY